MTSLINNPEYTHSPIETIQFRGHSLFIKRDDLLGDKSQFSGFSGNKARKFYHLFHADLLNINKVISYGSAQSNALYALSILAKLKGWEFDFYVDHIPAYLKQNPIGNYAAAIENGARIMSIRQTLADKSIERDIEKSIRNSILPTENNTLFIPEGGRYTDAEQGIKQLADEIAQWASNTSHQTKQSIDDLKVFLPSGTGTTALFLQKHLPFQVMTCACVGDASYLKQQFTSLCPNTEKHPTILPTPAKNQTNATKNTIKPQLQCHSSPTPTKYHFGKLHRDFYQIWHELLQQTGIEFDLLYDPLGWLTLLNYLQEHSVEHPVLYIHQGGLLGNQSMLPRYQRKYPQFNTQGLHHG